MRVTTDYLEHNTGNHPPVPLVVLGTPASVVHWLRPWQGSRVCTQEQCMGTGSQAVEFRDPISLLYMPHYS